VSLPSGPATASPYLDDTAAPRGRRLKPVTADGIIRAVRAGVPKGMVARAYGVSVTTVQRLAGRVGTRVEQDLDALSELAHLEEELAEFVSDEQTLRDAIRLIRAGHLLRKSQEARDASV
jgi:hypothetical protein